MILGNRLKAVVEAIGECKCIADIGSDHAKVGLTLLSRGKARRAIASDIRQGPLNRGMANAKRLGIKDIDFVLSDGFENLNPRDYDCAALCGMGGLLITNILRDAGAKAHCPLVLQPMTAYEKLRKYLWDNGFEIKVETFVTESDKAYVIISSLYTGISETYSYTDLYLGKIRPFTPEFAAFCKKVLINGEKRLKGALHKGLPHGDLDALLDECNSVLEKQA